MTTMDERKTAYRDVELGYHVKQTVAVVPDDCRGANKVTPGLLDDDALERAVRCPLPPQLLLPDAFGDDICPESHTGTAVTAVAASMDRDRATEGRLSWHQGWPTSP
jgi:hypothetical protein